MKLFQIIYDWAELWALLIPISVISLHKPKNKEAKWLTRYVYVALILNGFIIAVAQFYNIMPPWLKNNNIFYNIHSVCRVTLFSLFILSVRTYRFGSVLKYLLVLYFIFVVVNFTFFDNIFFLSSNLYAAESVMLLIICLSYFFRSVLDESTVHWLKHPSFLVCIGICLYEVITFFVFLFFNIISYSNDPKDRAFARIFLMIYSITFVLLCVSIAITLYKYRKKTELKTN